MSNHQFGLRNKSLNFRKLIVRSLVCIVTVCGFADLCGPAVADVVGCASFIGDVVKNTCDKPISLNWIYHGLKKNQILTPGASAYLMGIANQPLLICDNLKGEQAHFDSYGHAIGCKPF